MSDGHRNNSVIFRPLHVQGIGEPVGFVDDAGRNYYIMDNSGTFNSRLNAAELSQNDRSQAFQEYLGISKKFDDAGYQGFLISDVD